jgi:hypothetical protein
MVWVNWAKNGLFGFRHRFTGQPAVWLNTDSGASRFDSLIVKTDRE